MSVRTLMKSTAAIAAAAAAITAAACDEPLRDLTGPTPDLQPTFESIRKDIFETTDLAGRTSCITCHTSSGRTPAGNLNMSIDPYAAMVGVPSRQRTDLMIVAPGNPDASYLIHKLEGPTMWPIVNLQMPRNGPPYLTAGQIQVIRRWIEIGAPR